MTMRKFLLVPVLFLLSLFLFSGKASAKVSCPSSEIQCGSLDAQGGCADDCLRVVTRGTGGSRGGISWCQCQKPQSSAGTISEGGKCQTGGAGGDCVTSAPYCWAEPGQAATCHTTSPGTYPSPKEEEQQDPTCKQGTGIDTAIGCIPITDTNAFIGFILRWAIGIGGGIAFLLIVYAAFMIMSSSGNPERLKAGQELLTSAIAGLIMLIFSVFILKVIGVDILGLGKFGFGE